MIIKKCKLQEKINATLDCEVKQDYLFNEIVNEMSSANKPIIVHNGFLDLMHVPDHLWRFIYDFTGLYLTNGKPTEIE